MKIVLGFIAALVLSGVIHVPSAHADYRFPTQAGRTCSGQEAGPAAQLYFFGFKKEGFCATRPFYANSYGEAQDCARRICPECRVEDITGRYSISSGVPDMSGSQGYCPPGK